jgi:sterol desaturase/sphingolipid hydroxylase (fatty acid hydroxylase superfamily)
MTLDATLAVILAVGLGGAGLAMGLLDRASRWPRTRRYLISADAHRNASDAALRRSFVVNSVVSLVMVLGLTIPLRHLVFHDRPTALHRLLLEGVAVVLIYDFAYYFMHRYLFHEWRILRAVHAVHHAALNPRAIDSFLLHPVENGLGLALLLASIAVVGGIHILTFGPIFVGYTLLNVFNHAGLAFPFPPLKTLGKLAVAHDKHHHSMRSGNYASLTPLPDIVFGTLE